MNYKQLISLCDPIEVSGTEPDKIGALRQDSRKVKECDVFIAIRGFRADGHQFVEEAVENGASVIISEEAFSATEGVHIVQVANTRTLIGPLAQAFAGNPTGGMNIIGITGTNGKTTVATLTFQVLQQLNAKAGLLGTVEKRIGDEAIQSSLTTADPIELASDMKQAADAGVTHLVMEVSSHALDQERVKGIHFNIGAFTNLSHDHLDYHENLNDYARSKRKLFELLSPEATAIINGDDDQAKFMAAHCEARIINFSFTQALDVDCQILENSTDGLTVRVGQTLIESPLMGSFNAYNIAETFLICRSLGYDEQTIAHALAQATGAAGRLERVGESEGQPVVLVDYAHTPDALENVLQTLADIKTDQQQLQVVFGCGGDRDNSKRPKMAAIAERYADHITVTSDNPRSEDPEAIIEDIMPGFEKPSAVIRIPDRKKAIIQSIQNAKAESMILIAGKGHETYQEVNGERHDFDDRLIAKQALENRKMNSQTTGT